jgi:SAM-dependent methyltransferase
MNDSVIAGSRWRPERVIRSARKRLRSRFYSDGDTHTQWCRIVMNRRVGEHLRSLGTGLTAIEVSGSSHKHRAWKDYRSTSFQDLDLCHPPASLDQYDVVVCEQVLEHVVDPWRAVQTLHDLAKPGGHLVIGLPFLCAIHGIDEYWRFTQTGATLLLESAGLVVDEIDSWGDARTVKGHARRFPPYRPWRPLRAHDPARPIVIWVLAHRPADGEVPVTRPAVDARDANTVSD